MVLVEELFPGKPYKTRLWLSQRAIDELADYRDNPPGRFLAKVKHYAKNGFGAYANSTILKREWRGVWRIADGRFRLIGFFENDFTKGDFIALDAFLKRGQELSRAQRARIDKVADIKESGAWMRSSGSGRDSRLT
jgi:hypothetical protein